MMSSNPRSGMHERSSGREKGGRSLTRQSLIIGMVAGSSLNNYHIGFATLDIKEIPVNEGYNRGSGERLRNKP